MDFRKYCPKPKMATVCIPVVLVHT
jgi:hypothetical protein